MLLLLLQLYLGGMWHEPHLTPCLYIFDYIMHNVNPLCPSFPLNCYLKCEFCPVLFICKTVCNYTKLVISCHTLLEQGSKSFPRWELLLMNCETKLKEVTALRFSLSFLKTCSGIMPRKMTARMKWWTFALVCYHHEEVGCSLW